MTMNSLLFLKGRDITDVLVISFLIHRLVLLFRGTTTLQIVVALSSLWVIYGMAQALGLALTSWFLENMGTVMMFVIVVVFRNEIREVLIETSPVRLFLGRPTPTKALERRALAEAVFELARTRTGALLVFQRRHRLTDVVRNGITLGGRFSPQILESIFTKESPVHDGAAVLVGNRIDRVGTILPLTNRHDLPSEYGTRHRAAIGLSDACDAAVVVVSEERGEVSLVYKGMVERVEDPEQLEQDLGRLLGRVTKRRYVGWLRELGKQVGGYLLTALVIATSWSIYSGRQHSMKSITTHIDFRNVPSDMELRYTSAEKVEVHVTGKGPLVDSLRPEQVRAYIDLAGAQPGRGWEILLSNENITLPPGLEVQQLNPSRISLDLERRVRKDLRIRPRLLGTLPPGVQLGSTDIDPATVTVQGTDSILADLSRLDTEPIDLGRLDPTQPEAVVDTNLVLYPASLRLVERDTKKVRVTFHLIPIRPQTPPRPPDAPPEPDPSPPEE